MYVSAFFPPIRIRFNYLFFKQHYRPPLQDSLILPLYKLSIIHFVQEQRFCEHPPYTYNPLRIRLALTGSRPTSRAQIDNCPI